MEMFRYQLGITLTLIGVVIGMFLSYQVPTISWSPIVMILSILLLMDYKKVHKIFMPLNGVFIPLFIFQILMLVFWFLTYQGKEQSIKYLNFHLYIIALIFVINSNKKLVKVNFIKPLFVISSFLAIMFAFYHYTDIYTRHKMELQKEAILEPFTMDIAAYANMMCCLVLFSWKKKWFAILLGIMTIIDFYVIARSGKRSYFVSIFVAILLYIYNSKNKAKTISIIIIVTLVSVFLFDAVYQMFTDFLERTISGLVNVYGERSVAFDETDSSTYRAMKLRWVMNFVNSNFTISNYLLGSHYLFAWIDNPLLESYLDMGIAGLCLYSYLIIVYPIRVLRGQVIKEKSKLILIMIAVVNITVCITNNNPYEYFVYTPICLLGGYEAGNGFPNLRKLIKSRYRK